MVVQKLFYCLSCNRDVYHRRPPTAIGSFLEDEDCCLAAISLYNRLSMPLYSVGTLDHIILDPCTVYHD